MKRKSLIVIAFCLVASVLLLWLCNSLWDSRYSFGKGDSSIINAALSKKLISNSVQRIDEILPVNVSYDRQLVPIADSHGIPVGEVDIADRAKLKKLLSCLKEYGNYRYIVCDIAFDEAYKTDSDDDLYAIISSMQNIVVPGESANLPIVLNTASAPSAYYITHHGSPFFKFQFSEDGQRSIPLRMWNDLTGNDIVKHWWGYSFKDGRRCNNAAVLDLTNIMDYSNQTLSLKEGNIAIEEKFIYHLGSDILDCGCPPELFENKIVLIGDFYERDMHDTAIGQVPGIMLLFSAYQTLESGRNRIPSYCYLILLFLFSSYFILIYFKGGWKIDDKLISYLIDSFSFTIPLEVFNYFAFLLGGFAVDAVLIGSLFGFLSYLRKIPKRK